MHGYRKKNANKLYAQIDRHISELNFHFDYLSPPPLKRVRQHEKRRIDHTKDWSNSYLSIKQYSFVIRRYIEILRALIADIDNSKIYKSLYIFKNAKNLSNFSSFHDEITNEKAENIFSDPDNRIFSEFDLNFILNQSEKDIKAFAKYLVSLAHDIRQIDHPNISLSIAKSTIYKLSRIYLLGPQGSGKTTLLNYLFSTYSQKFFENKVLWFRIDFNDRKRRGEPIDKAIMRQFIKILNKVYINDDKTKLNIDWDDFEESLKIDRQIKSRISNLTSSTPEVVKIKNIGEKFILNLINYLKLKGWAFIFILDGLDRLSLERYDTDSWKNLSDSLLDTFFDEGYLKAVFILSIRYTTYQHISETFENRVFLDGAEQMTVHLLPKDILEILNSKFEIADRNILRDIEKKSDQKKFSIINKESLLKFRELILLIFPTGLGVNEDDYTTLLKISGYNYRILFRTLKRVIDYFGWIIIDHFVTNNGPYQLGELFSKLKQKKYHILKAFIFGDDLRKDYLTNYKYEFDGRKIIFRRNAYGRALAPSIFNFIETIGNTGIWDNFQIRTLLKVHCIEFLLETKEAKLNEVIEFLIISYGYDRYYILAELEEMICEGMIVNKDLKNAFRNDFIDMVNVRKPSELDLNGVFRATRLGIHIYSNFIEDINYLSYIINDLPLPKPFFKFMKPINYFREGMNTNKYVTRKIFNTLVFIKCFLEPLSEMEINYFNNLELDPSLRKKYIKIVKLFPKKLIRIKSSIEKSIISILSERLANDEKHFLTELSKVFIGIKYSEGKASH